MCISVFSANIAVAKAVDKTVYVKNVLDVSSMGMQENTVTYLVNLKPNVFKFNGAIIYVEFDENVLSLESVTPITVTDADGNEIPKIQGEYLHGFMKNSVNKYSLAYMNTSGYTTSGYETLYKVTFRAIAPERPKTDVKFYCKEVFTDDDKNNDVRPSDGEQLFASFNFSTLNIPTPLSATLLDDGIRFAFKEVEGAEKYTVLRKANDEGVWYPVKELPSGVTIFTDTDVKSGITYTYSVTSGNGYGNSGYLAKGVSQLYLLPPKVNIITQNDSLKITWEAVEGATSYAVYRKDSSEGQWALLTKTSSQKFEYVDSTVQSNVNYYYSVVAENGNVLTRTGANEKSQLFLAAPLISTIENVEAGIRIAWNIVAGADSYELYRRMSLNEDWELVSSSKQSSYLDTDVKTGFTYFYTLKTVKNGVQSSYNSTGVSIARIIAPEVYVPAALGDSINVSWSKVDGVTGYTVYRKAKNENNFSKVMSVGSTVTQLKDDTVDSGTYFYGVTANIGQYESLLAKNNNQVYFLKAPQNTDVVNEVSGIKVSWDATKNASYYIIKRTENNTDYEKIIAANVTNTFFVDESVTNLSKYSYSVKAVDTDGYQNVGDVFTQPIYRVVPPDLVSAVSGAGKVTITFKSVSGAESYNIYRRQQGGDWVNVGSTTTADEFSDETVVSGVKYDYTVTAVKGNSQSYIGEDNLLSITYVSTPTDLTATIKSAGVLLNWNVGDGLSSFAIYKRVKGQTEWNEIARPNSTVTTLLDEDVLSGVTYEYTIKSFSSDGTYESGFSELATVIYLSKVSKIKITSNSSGVNISWGKVNGAEQYIVYRRLTNGSWETLGLTANSKTSYLDKKAESGKTYYYTVRALTSGYRSDYSAVKFYYLAAPKITKFESDLSKGITIKWADVHGAEQYYVYRKQGSSGWKKIGTTENLLFRDKNVKLGTKYTYTIRANGNGTTSPYYTAGWSRTYTPNTPVVTSISNTTNSITLKWGKVSGATSYVVYRKANDAKSWSKIATVKTNVYTDKKVSNGVKYTYTVRAAKSKVLSEYNKTGWNRTILSIPTVKIANASNGMKVSWSKVKGALGYTVYVSEYNEKTKQWTSWKNRGTAKSNKSSWVDKNVKSGKYYKYTVRAINGSSKSNYKSSASLLYLAQPTVKIANAQNGVKVSWSKSGGAAGYTVYKSVYNASTGKWTSWKNMGTAKYTKSSWVDKSVKSGDTVKYTVRAVNGKVKSTYKESSSLMFLSTPVLLNGYKTAEGNVIEYQKVFGAYGYKIYRKTADTAWVEITILNSTQTSYKDVSVNSNTEYIYTVRAVRNDSISSYDANGIICK